MTMKKLFWFSLAVLLFVFGWVTGYSSALVVTWYNPPFSKSVSVSDLKCTCVPCLPGHYCRKCGHVSRDCPKLRWYFHPTNAVNRAAFSTNQPPLDLAN